MATAKEDKIVRGADLAIVGAQVKAKLAEKQDILVSGTNIKTINNTSLLGSGDITILDGEDGASAYELWLAAGNTGSMDDFLASLQGNSGYQGEAGELEVVNNLTDGGATSALSAEMGKSLKRNADKTSDALKPISDIFYETRTEDPDNYTTRAYWINDSNKYGSTATYRHILIPVNEGDLVKVVAGVNSTTLAWFTSNATPSSGGTPPFVDGTVKIVVDANSTFEQRAPATTKYLYVYRGEADAYSMTPTSIEITEFSYDPERTVEEAKTSDVASVGLVIDAIFDNAGYIEEEIDLESVPIEDYNIIGTAYDSTGTHGKIIVEYGDVIHIKSNGGNVGFLNTIYCPYASSAAGVSDSWQTNDGDDLYFRAPYGANAFFFNTLPESITKYIPADREESNIRVMSAERFTPSNGVLVYAAYTQNRNKLIKVKGGHRYTLNIQADTATVNVGFIEDLPRINLTYTASGYTSSANTNGKATSITVTPSTDGYYFIRANKSGGPTLTVSAYLADDYALPISDTTEIESTNEFWRYNINALTKRNYSLSGENGLYGTSTSYKHVCIPINGGQYVKIIPGENSATFAWVTSDAAPASAGEIPYVPGTGRINTSTGGIYRAPGGTKFILIYAGSSANAYNMWPKFVALSIDYASMPDIVRDNDYAKTRRILSQISNTTRSEDDANLKPLVLLHYSDIHGRKTCQNRINDYRGFWKDYIDDTIQTGDLVTSYWSQESAFDVDESVTDNPNKDILCIIGNHDTATYSSGTYNWHAKQGLEAYNRYFAPFIANWNVTQPANADSVGKCYYYKDYIDSKIRLVCLDTFDNDETYKADQQAWFVEVLNDAITNGLSVIVASHFRIKCETLLKCPFTNPTAATADPDTSLCNDPYIPLVKNFIDGGGKFICWLTGHSHYDAISKTSAANGSQINVCIAHAGRVGSAATSLYESDSKIATVFDDWKTFDAFNIMAVDTYLGVITLFRVGSSWDKYGRHIETVCIDYRKGELLYL